MRVSVEPSDPKWGPDISRYPMQGLYYVYLHGWRVTVFDDEHCPKDDEAYAIAERAIAAHVLEA